MSQTSHANTGHLSGDSASGGQPHIYPIESFVKIQALMRKLNLTPADCLQILSDVLEDIDSQAMEHEAVEDTPLPKWVHGL